MGRHAYTDISPRQQEILHYINRFKTSHGYAPSYREIGQACGLRSLATISVHLERLAAFGYIRRHQGKRRGLESTGKSYGELP